MKNVQNYIVALLMLLITSFPLTSHAQIIEDPGDDPDAPIDGGISVLIAAGIVYGIKKYRDQKDNKNEPDDNLK